MSNLQQGSICGPVWLRFVTTRMQALLTHCAASLVICVDVHYSCRFSLYEPVEFIKGFLMDKLEWNKVRDNVAIHVPCSSKKMGIEAAFEEIASKCAHEVTHSGIPCCGKLLSKPLSHHLLPLGTEL